MENNTQEMGAVNQQDDGYDIPIFDDQERAVPAPASADVTDIEEARQRRAELGREGPDALSDQRMAKALKLGWAAIEREEARKAKKQDKQAPSGAPEATSSADPSLALRYARHFASCEEIRVGGGRKGRTVYVWNGAEARWVAQDEDEARSHATEWLSHAMPDKADSGKAGLCLETALDLFGRKSSKRLPEQDPRHPILPVIGAYLRIGDDGVITASYPDMADGVTHRVPAQLDWSRVDEETSVYTPLPLRADSLLADYLNKFVPDQEIRDLLQEAVGSSLMPAGGWHKAFVLSGGGGSINKDGANGKSTLLHLLEALHPENVIVDLTTLDKDASAMADLEGKTLAISSETPDFLGKQVEVKLKAIIAGDQVRGRALYQNARYFEPKLSLWISLNGGGIRFQDRSAAMEERFLWIPFNKRIARDSDENKKNFHLSILNSPEEMAVLLDWALEGVARLCRNGKRFSAKPGCIKAADEARRIETDPTYAWMVEGDVAIRGCEETSKAEIYAAYRQDMRDQENRPLASAQFWRALYGFVEGRGEAKIQGRHTSGTPRVRTVNVTVAGVPSSVYLWDQQPAQPSGVVEWDNSGEPKF